MSVYLQQLTVRLASGVGQLPADQRQIHTDYFLNAQRDDGGFAGRMGGSDLYYTSFGLRALSILGQLYGPVAESAAAFLKQEMKSHQTIVDFFSLFYAANLLKVSAGVDVFEDSDVDWQSNVANFLDTLRREDGGYAKAPQGHAGSTYHTFLVVLVMQLLDRPVPHVNEVVQFLQSQQDPEGGWREIRASKRAGTNPTAAAVATLQILEAQKRNQQQPVGDVLDHGLKELTLDYLCEMQTDEGGIRANTRIPIADLLSSFTGGLTLMDLDSFDELDVDLFAGFVNSLQLKTGGFQAAAWDDADDVEYSFYGLGCLALLNQAR
jgi:geranylgeranyl transferase type-2 subunit beta